MGYGLRRKGTHEFWRHRGDWLDGGEGFETDYETFDDLDAGWEDEDEEAELLAKKAETASNELATAAQAGDDAKMQSSMQTINGACGQCHMAHREGSPGAFKIK